MTPKIIRTGLALVAGSFLTVGLLAQAPKPKIEFPAASPGSIVKQRVGLTDIEIEYSRPGVKGRKIFGGLEAYGEIWRTGANSATKITFSTPVKFGGADVPAGSYALFSMPGQDEWTVILNKVTGQWGSYAYDAKNDVVRVTTKPVDLAAPVESFTIDINDLRDESATLNLIWEKTRVPVKLEVQVTATLVPQIEAAMADPTGKPPYASAAMFYLEHNLDLKKAAGWMDAAIAANPKAFYLVYRKALILEKMGDKAGAIATAQQSMDAARKETGAVKDEYIRLNTVLIERLR